MSGFGNVTVETSLGTINFPVAPGLEMECVGVETTPYGCRIELRGSCGLASSIGCEPTQAWWVQYVAVTRGADGLPAISFDPGSLPAAPTIPRNERFDEWLARTNLVIEEHARRKR